MSSFFSFLFAFVWLNLKLFDGFELLFFLWICQPSSFTLNGGMNDELYSLSDVDVDELVY